MTPVVRNRIVKDEGCGGGEGDCEVQTVGVGGVGGDLSLS